MSMRDEVRALCAASLAEIAAIRAPDVLTLRLMATAAIARLIFAIETRYGAHAGAVARDHFADCLAAIIDPAADKPETPE